MYPGWNSSDESSSRLDSIKSTKVQEDFTENFALIPHFHRPVRQTIRQNIWRSYLESFGEFQELAKLEKHWGMAGLADMVRFWDSKFECLHLKCLGSKWYHHTGQLLRSYWVVILVLAVLTWKSKIKSRHHRLSPRCLIIPDVKYSFFKFLL